MFSRILSCCPPDKIAHGDPRGGALISPWATKDTAVDVAVLTVEARRAVNQTTEKTTRTANPPCRKHLHPCLGESFRRLLLLLYLPVATNSAVHLIHPVGADVSPPRRKPVPMC